MIPVNPNMMSAAKRAQLVREHLGLPTNHKKGRFSFRDGITGLEFHDTIDGHTIVYNVSIETYELGLLVYCRYFTLQKWIVIPFSSLSSISVIKKPDIIKKMHGSWFRLLEQLGWGYRTARIFILEKEWIRMEKLNISLIDRNKTHLNLVAKEKNHNRIIRYFSGMPVQHKVHIDVSNYTYE